MAEINKKVTYCYKNKYFITNQYLAASSPSEACCAVHAEDERHNDSGWSFSIFKQLGLFLTWLINLSLEN